MRAIMFSDTKGITKTQMKHPQMIRLLALSLTERSAATTQTLMFYEGPAIFIILHVVTV